MIELVIKMQEYLLFLVMDEAITTDYFSNKYLVEGGDLVYLDAITTAFQDAQDMGDDINDTQNHITFTNAILVPRRDYLAIMQDKTRFAPKRVEKGLFSDQKDFFDHACFLGDDVSIQNIYLYPYIRILIEKYKDYLWNHKKEIAFSLVRFVRIPEVVIDASISYDDLEKVFYAYYYSGKPSYKKIRDTYLEMNRFNFDNRFSKKRGK